MTLNRIKKFFPIIKFVDKWPLDLISVDLREKLVNGRQMAGVCTLYPNGIIKIHILRRRAGRRAGLVITWIHEICHWLIFKTTKILSDRQGKYHKLVDRYL